MTPFAVAGVQMSVNALGENVTLMRQKIDVAMAHFPWINMLVFSELAAFGPLYKNHPASLDETLSGLCEMAKRYKIWLIPGSMFEKREDKVYNTAVVINPEGEIVGCYDKLFPFMPYEKDVEGGNGFLVWDVPYVGRFGISICYDIWLPETTRTLTAMGAEVIIHPVLTGTTDRDVELAIARATAAQFQCFVVDVNGLKAGGKGRSCVVAPGGQVMYQSGESEDIFPLQLDLDQVRYQREFGNNGLGQTLKSYRDRKVNFTCYQQEKFDHSYYNSLGPLKQPSQLQYDHPQTFSFQRPVGVAPNAGVLKENNIHPEPVNEQPLGMDANNQHDAFVPVVPPEEQQQAGQASPVTQTQEVPPVVPPSSTA